MPEFLLICLGIPGFILFMVLIGSIRQVNQYERGILFTMGKYSGVVNSGWRFIIPVFQSLVKVDIRTKTVDLADQAGMTHDNVSIQVGAVVFFKVTDSSKAVLEVENYHWAISQLSETTMRTVIGEVPLNELLSNREDVANRIEQVIQPKAEEWGVQIVGVELKDIVLPEDMKRTMAKQAEAERERMAVITKAQGELEASENLAKAAEMMAKTPGALHLRTLSTINDLSSDQSNTIVFALPVEVLRAFEAVTNKNSDSTNELVDKIANALRK